MEAFTCPEFALQRQQASDKDASFELWFSVFPPPHLNSLENYFNIINNDG